MKYIVVLLPLFLLACQDTPKSPFEQRFTDATLRIDYYHKGDGLREAFNIDAPYRYDGWAGSKVHLIDTLDYGTYYHKVYDKASGTLIYSRGFDSYFMEYQTTTAAREGRVREFHETAIVPMPRDSIEFAIERRLKDGTMRELFRVALDPAETLTGPSDSEVEVIESQISGDPAVRADIAIIGEGYTADEAEKFRDDVARFTEIFFQAEPCKSYRDRFNIRGVLKPSEDSGVDEPRAGIDKNTAVSASFNALGSERYLLVEDQKALRDVAGHVPYDALYVMINHTRYGGGGIYNFYCTYTSDNIHSAYLMVHEFGHSFFGLADEYYTSSTAYTDFHTPEHEPAEPNITALLDPDNIKWKHLLTPGIDIPTPWAKAEYDSVDIAWQAERARLNDRIAELQREGAPQSEIQAAKDDYDRKSAARSAEVQAYLENSPYAGQVGAFEGAGYQATGLYRPSINCIMFTRAEYFCRVCQEAMKGIIDWYAM
ncbi:MAG: M64 family metallopeptidase [Saprospiraceae bacterium]|nr:M64 family metallopeptidase [Saprospiraceae bacterium]